MKVSDFGRLIGKKAENFRDTEIGGFSIDSRTLKKGDMFIAIKTDKNDGHRYLEDAKKKGAVAFLVSSRRKTVGLKGFENVFYVSDTLIALQKAAKKHAETMINGSVAITGSAGKTTTKELICRTFRSYFNTRCTPGNFNNTLGLPLSILNEINQKIDYFVAELGMSFRGEIKKLVDILNPEIRVWLNVYSAHIGNFNSLEEVREAKSEILLNADEKTIIVFNCDDILVKTSVDRFVGIKYSFGYSDSADLKIKRCVTGLDSSSVEFEYQGMTLKLHTGLVGRFNCYNIAAAILTSLIAGIPKEKILNAMNEFKAIRNRGRFVLKEPLLLYDDCYNSNPDALRRVLSHFSRVEYEGRKVAIVGDMLELDNFSEELHSQIGKQLEESDFDVVITWGNESEMIHRQLKTKEKYHFNTNIDIANSINDILQKGDLVIVKASRGMKGEVIVNSILEFWREK